MDSISTTRLYFLDWLRVLAFGLLVFYHTGLIFVDWGFHISNDLFSESLKFPMLFVNQWRLPLLFFVSGAGIYFALGKRNVSKFAKERFTRIFIPLVFGILVVVPPQVYLEWKHHGAFQGSYWEFYPVFFRHITWNHLWFLVYLFTFTFLALPLFLYLRSDSGKLTSSSIALLLAGKKCILILVIPLFLIELGLRTKWPDNRNLVSDWYNFVFYFLLMIYGYFFASAPILWKEMEQYRKIYLLLGLISFSLIYFGWHQPGINFLENLPGGKYLFDFFKCINILSWIFCFLGFSRRYLNKNSVSLQYLNKAVYPFFILHQTVLIFIGFYVIQWERSMASKFFLIVAGTFLLTMLTYELILRRSGVVGSLLGVNHKKIL
jgi:glucans biosynthesis protein C